MRVHDLKFLTIDLKETPVKHLVTKWIGHASTEDFLKGIETILDTMQKHNIKHVLNDIREQQVIGVDAQEGAAQRVKAYIGKNGMFKQAMLSSRDVFIKFASQNFDKKVQGTVKDEVNRFFDKETDAVAWLATQKL